LLDASQFDPAADLRRTGSGVVAMHPPFVQVQRSRACGETGTPHASAGRVIDP